MKTLKSLKFALVLVALFSISACELIEEPNFDDTTAGESTNEDANPE